MVIVMAAENTPRRNIHLDIPVLVENTVRLDMKLTNAMSLMGIILILRQSWKGMDFLQELEWRGMVHNKIPGVEDYLSKSGQKGYIGFDPTASSMTIGNYVQLMILSFFQKSGHQPIILMGGATGRIGDPSGKDKERQLLNYDIIEANLKAQTEQAKRLMAFDSGAEVMFENNYDFYKDMNVLDYLRDLGKTLTVSYMLSKDTVKSRLESGLSYTEFSYQILQGYDFLHLYRKHGCGLQMGGSDQWGNITSGTEFIRRSEPNAKAYAVTTPLLTKSDGSKFGKSESGNIWLDAKLTSPYQFYQFWINADDNDLKKFYRYFSFKEREEITSLEKEHESNPNNLKRILADELTIRVHSKTACDNAKNVSELLFGRSINADTIRSFDEPTMSEVEQEIPSFRVGAEIIGKELVEVLAGHTDIFSSKSEALRAIKGNALGINKVKVNDAATSISKDHLLNGNYIFVENGKKKKYMLVVR